MKKRCNSCGRVMDHVVGPAQLDDGTMFVLIVDRCQRCGINIVNEKIPILETIKQLTAEGRRDRDEENTSEDGDGEDAIEDEEDTSREAAGHKSGDDDAAAIC